MFDVVQKAQSYCGDLKAEIRKVDEFLRFAEDLIRMDDAEKYPAPVESIARPVPLTRPVEVPAPRLVAADTTNVEAPPTAARIKTDSLFRGAFDPFKREFDAG
jgi:hypothetical protein